ncbi:helix-turn-helix domain-containing protein [Kitasatospora sp. NPDC059408]|uniref:helix-turn-helix domain-containing protein n=1 Tax=Kitasatospora sp. NPDC059408 TaxID=3346823 RepID=UPI0036BE5FB8
MNARSLREAAALAGDTTDYRIAKRSGLARATLSRLVNGRVEPSVTNVMRLAKCYGVTVESLLRPVDVNAAVAA